MREDQRPKAEGRRAASASTFCLLCSGFCLLLVLPGCGPQPDQPSAYERQEKALKDPFGYNPDLKKSDMSVSGNGEFDKDGLHRDLDHVLNP